VGQLREALGAKPLLGICLGFQLLALACGAQTYKLKFGHRGANQPVRDLRDGSVSITSQNHGFGVDRQSLEAVGAEVTHVHLNDGSVSGFVHPNTACTPCSTTPRRRPVRTTPAACSPPSSRSPVTAEAALTAGWRLPAGSTVLVIGSGPIVIGQACEFDYSGTQACKALRARATASCS
jgi:hypothetical protein